MPAVNRGIGGGGGGKGDRILCHLGGREVFLVDGRIRGSFRSDQKFVVSSSGGDVVGAKVFL